MQLQPFGKTGVVVPQIVYGSSALGNLYEAIPDSTKLELTRQWFAHHEPPSVIDSAGKYGAGLALEMIGRNLALLEIDPERVVISNKLGWKRVPLTTDEPTFEPGAWVDLEFDAVQCISYEGILECWRQGCELLGDRYRPQLLSVHDPDEYLAAASTATDRVRRFEDILGAYKALDELKRQGKAAGIGVGSKDWQVIQEIDRHVPLDWVMLANSLTVYRHPPELLQFVEELRLRNVGIVNSAVFHAGFLVGGRFFDYRPMDPNDATNHNLFAWREKFHALCAKHGVSPSLACIQYGLSIPGVDAVALNTTEPDRVAKNVAAISATVRQEFWDDLAGLPSESP